MAGCGCTASSMFVFVGLVMVAFVFAGEGTLADDPSRDTSKDSSDDDNSKAVFKSIKPLESAIMPVCWTHIISSAEFAALNRILINLILIR